MGMPAVGKSTIVQSLIGKRNIFSVGQIPTSSTFIESIVCITVPKFWAKENHTCINISTPQISTFQWLITTLYKI